MKKTFIVIVYFLFISAVIIGGGFARSKIVYAEDVTISSAQEFKEKLNDNPAGSFIQIADFDLPADWVGPTDFHGTYNGNGYTIKGGLSSTEIQWLFNNIFPKNWTTTIKNVYIENCGMIPQYTLGGNNVNVPNKLIIENCHIDITHDITRTAGEMQAWLSFFVCESGVGSYSGRSYGSFYDSSVRIHDNVNITLNGVYSGDYSEGHNPGGIGLFACRGLDLTSDTTTIGLSFSNCFVYLGKNSNVVFNYLNNTINYKNQGAGSDRDSCAGVGGFVASSRGLSNVWFDNCYVFMDEDSQMKSVKKAGGRDDCVIPVGSFFGSVKGKVQMNNCYCFNFGKLAMESEATPFTTEQLNRYLHLDIGVKQYAGGSDPNPTIIMTNMKFYIDTVKNDGIGYLLEEDKYDRLSLNDLTNPDSFLGMIDTTDDLSDNTKLFVMDSTKSPGGGSGFGMPFLKQEVQNEINPEIVTIPFTGKKGEMIIEEDVDVIAYTLGELSTITIDFAGKNNQDLVVIEQSNIAVVDGVSSLYLDISISKDWLNDTFSEEDIGKEYELTYAFDTGRVVRGKIKIIDGNVYPTVKKREFSVPNTGIK